MELVESAPISGATIMGDFQWVCERSTICQVFHLQNYLQFACFDRDSRTCERGPGFAQHLAARVVSVFEKPGTPQSRHSAAGLANVFESLAIAGS